MPPPRLSLPEIERAQSLIDPVFLDTPQYECEPLSRLLGVRLILKIEVLNPIRAFKGRGADLLVSRVESGSRLICASAGNFGQAMAYACRARALPLTVYAAECANALKIERMRDLGAEVVLHGEDFDAAKIEARRVAAESGVRFVEDGFDVDTVLGAGTMAVELLRSPEPFDALLVPLGNGAMFNGIATVVKARSPGTRMIAVQASGAPAMIASWRAGRVIEHKHTATIADGIAVRIPVPQALDDMRPLIDDALLVGESTILAALRLIHRHVGIVVEPSAAVGVAALLESEGRFAGKRVATILCGGNVTEEQLREWLGST